MQRATGVLFLSVYSNPVQVGIKQWHCSMCVLHNCTTSKIIFIPGRGRGGEMQSGQTCDQISNKFFFSAVERQMLFYQSQWAAIGFGCCGCFLAGAKQEWLKNYKQHPKVQKHWTKPTGGMDSFHFEEHGWGCTLKVVFWRVCLCGCICSVRCQAMGWFATSIRTLRRDPSWVTDCQHSYVRV